MGRGKMACLYKGNYILEINKMVEKQREKDSTARYNFEEVKIEDKTRKLIIEIFGNDKTINDTYKESTKALNKFNNKVALKSMRTTMKVEMIP
jgi:hypothetical protein